MRAALPARRDPRPGRSPAWPGSTSSSRFGFATPIPSSVVQLYMGIAVALPRRLRDLEREAARGVRRPDRGAGAASRAIAFLLGAILVLLPALAGGERLVREPGEARGPGLRAHRPPGAARHDHRPRPDDRPRRAAATRCASSRRPTPRSSAAHVASGRRIYYQNCFFCHGDALAGDGMFAHGLNPIPTNFTDKGTIAQLQESFLFWRIAKGGPGPAGRRRPVGLGHARVGEVPDRGGDVGGRSSSSTTTPGQRPRAAAEEH